MAARIRIPLTTTIRLSTPDVTQERSLSRDFSRSVRWCVWPLSRDSMALLQASKLAHGALGVAPAAYHLLQSLKGYASTTTGAAAAAAQPLTVDEAAEPADPRWRRELGVIRTDWT